MAEQALPTIAVTPSLPDHLAVISRLVRGEFTTDEQHCRAVSVDGSIFQVMPQAVLYPKDAGDIQAVARYLWEQAERGVPVPSLTPRGRGSDQAGGPLGNGIIVDCSHYLTQILEIGTNFVRVEPGVRYGELQAALKKVGRYLPPYPASLEICTIGGAVANNSSGEKAIKYGDTRDYVETLKVVLANGSEVELRSLTHAELEARGRHYTFEGKIYREMEKLLQAHTREGERPSFHVTKNATGYCLWQVQEHDRFDLTKLFVGSQGTLGIITEIVLRTLPLLPELSLSVGYFASIDLAARATTEIAGLHPSALEIVDKHLLMLVQERQPGHLDGLLPSRLPDIVLLVEFDDVDVRLREGKIAAARTILQKYAFEQRQAADEVEQQRLWVLRRSAAAVIWTVDGPEKALPIVEDGVVPPQLLLEFFARAYALFEEYDLRIAVWGHAGDANLHMQPFLNLSDPDDQRKIWPFVDAFHRLVIEMGGCISAEHNDGLLRSPYLEAQYGPELYGMFREIKRIFDPYHFLNPGKKVDVNLKDIQSHLRSSYTLDHLVTHAEQINR